MNAHQDAQEGQEGHECLEFESYRYHELLPQLRAAQEGVFDGAAVVGALQAALRALDDELSGKDPQYTGRREYAALEAKQLLTFLEAGANDF